MILPPALLQTPRLTIRRFRAADAPALSAYRSDPAVTRYESWSPPLPLAQAERLVQEFAAGDPLAPGWCQHAVELRATGDLIGDIGVGLHENRMQAEIGYRIAGPHQRRGYGLEAVGRMLEHLLDERRLHKVSAECDARNLASAGLLERLGFVREGLRRSHSWIKGEWTDDLVFGLLATDPRR